MEVTQTGCFLKGYLTGQRLKLSRLNRELSGSVPYIHGFSGDVNSGDIYDETSFLSGLAAGMCSEGWPGGVSVGGIGGATKSQCAEYGDFIDLRVDRLSTSKRIKKYLAGDTSDDNYIRIEGEQILHVAGIHTGGTEQAKNQSGQLLYWKSNPNPTGAGIITGSNGYPVIADADGNSIQVCATTTPTNWPVMVYTYTDQIKASISVELEKTPEDGTPVYAVTQILGAGNADGTNQAYIRKGLDGLEIMYTPNNHSDGTPRDVIGIKMSTNGELEIIGYDFIRKIASEDDLPDDWASQNRIFVIEEEE